MWKLRKAENSTLNLNIKKAMNQSIHSRCTFHSVRHYLLLVKIKAEMYVMGFAVILRW